jgi:hypothetical protein
MTQCLLGTADFPSEEMLHTTLTLIMTSTACSCIQAQSDAELQAAYDMQLDDKLGLNSNALPDARAATNAEVYASADSSSNAHELAGANADPEAAGVTDAASGGAAIPSSWKRAHSCMLPCTMAQSSTASWPNLLLMLL